MNLDKYNATIPRMTYTFKGTLHYGSMLLDMNDFVMKGVTCGRTARETNPWWQINLEQETTVYALLVVTGNSTETITCVMFRGTCTHRFCFVR